MKPTLGRASESRWEEHAPKLGVHIAGSHHYVECADVAHRISGTIISGEMGYFEPWWKWSVHYARGDGLDLLIRILSMDSSSLSLLCH